MEEYEIVEQEITFSEIVKYREIGKDVKFNIIDKTIIIEQKKGLFKKEYKIIEILPIKDITVEEQAKTIKIKTQTKIITIECYKDKDKKQLVKEIEKIKKQKKKIKLTKENLDKIAKIMSGVGKLATLAGTIILKINESKDK